MPTALRRGRHCREEVWSKVATPLLFSGGSKTGEGLILLTENVACEFNAAIEYDKEQGRCARDKASRDEARKYNADLQPVPGAPLFYGLSHAAHRPGCPG